MTITVSEDITGKAKLFPGRGQETVGKVGETLVHPGNEFGTGLATIHGAEHLFKQARVEGGYMKSKNLSQQMIQFLRCLRACQILLSNLDTLKIGANTTSGSTTFDQHLKWNETSTYTWKLYLNKLNQTQNSAIKQAIQRIIDAEMC